MTFKVVVPPTTEPITLEEARLHLRVTPNSDSPPTHPDDSLIQALITASRQWCENYLRRALAPQMVEVILDCFPANEIQLPFSPILDIVSLTYIDPNGDQQTLDPALYVLDNEQEPGWVLPVINTVWPTTYEVINAVRVRYNVGYTIPSDSPSIQPFPSTIRSAMLLLIGHWYENREAVIIGTIQSPLSFAVESLLLPYRLRLSLA